MKVSKPKFKLGQWVIPFKRGINPNQVQVIIFTVKKKWRYRVGDKTGSTIFKAKQLKPLKKNKHLKNN